MDPHALIPQITIRNLSDRLYEKRKVGATEMEGIVSGIIGAKDDVAAKKKITTILDFIHDTFIKSSSGNQRKGGLIALAGVAVGLKGETKNYLAQLLPPVIVCFEDTESRIRYYACESLYNIAKVVRGNILVFFNEIFDGICKLFADVDMDVRTGASMLDRLIKEIVSEQITFNVEKFIPLLHMYITVNSAYVRRLLISWVGILDSVPELDMLDWLPEYLDGLFGMLSDGNTTIRQEADQMLCILLKEIKDDHRLGDLDLSPIINILVQRSTDPDNFTRLSAVVWIHSFIETGDQKLIVFYAELLGTVLKCISDSDDDVCRAASSANDNLLSFVRYF
jgi:vacuole morphology and inheritance protein 14